MNNDTPADAMDALLDKRAKLVDDVRYYSGNEKAGYAEIAALDADIVKHLIRHRTTSLAAQDGLVEENERLRKLVQTYRGAQLRAEEKLCREQANAQGWKLRAQLLDEKLDALASIEVKS